MFRLALKSIKHRPGRLILSTFAVILGVALVSSTHVFTNGLTGGFSDLNADIYGGDRVIVELDPEKRFDVGEGPLLTDETIAAVEQVDGVDAAFGGTGSVTGFEATMLTSTQAVATQGGPSLFFNFTGDAEIDRATIVDGRGPTALGEIAMDATMAENSGYAVGDTVYVAGPNGIVEYTLVGTISFGETGVLQGASLNYLTLEGIRELLGTEGFFQIDARPAEGVDASELVNRIEEVIPDAARALTSADKVAEENAELDQVGNWIDIFGLAFAFISVFVGAYIVVNTFRIIVGQRTQELGLLRAIAASGLQVRTMILLESLVIATIATVLGLVVGYLLGAGILAGVGVLAGFTFPAAVLTLESVLWGVAVGYGVTIVAALGPAIHASRIAPLEALRDASTAIRKPLRVRNIVGGTLTLLALAAMFIGLYTDIGGAVWWIAGGAVGVVLGVTLLAAQVLVPLAYALRNVLTRTAGIRGKLAANNIRREPRRSANTAAALMIGVMLLSLTATFAESVRDLVKEQIAGNTTADLFVLGQGGPIQPGAIEGIEGLDGIETPMRIGFDEVQYGDEVVFLTVFDPETVDDVYVFNAEPSMTRVGDGVFIGPAIQEQGVEVGDTVLIDGPANDVELVVTGLYNQPNDGEFFVSWDVGEQILGDVEVLQYFVTTDRDIAELKAEVEDVLSEYPGVMAVEPSELVQAINDIVTIFIGIISGLLASSLIIAILGIANTLFLSVTERTREVGLLRAVGLTRRSVWSMITLESVVMAIFGTVLGIVMGTGFGVALLKALESEGFTTIVVPWAWLALYAVLSLVAGVLAAMWPARRAARLDILEAIKTE